MKTQTHTQTKNTLTTNSILKMLFIFLAMLTFHSKVTAQNAPILFINKTSCDIYVDPFCGACPAGGFNQGPVTVTIPPYDSQLFDGECTGDFAYCKFSIDGAVNSWYVAFADNIGDCGQDGDCIGVPSVETVSAGFIAEDESPCLNLNVKFLATFHPNSQGYTCQVVVYED